MNQAVVLALFSSVIKDTPVLTGRLRGNWLVTSENPASGVAEVTDPTGNKAIADVASLVGGMSGDFDVYLTNNLPYAYRVEYDGWSHTKAPAGMVRKNLIRISEKLAS